MVDFGTHNTGGPFGVIKRQYHSVPSETFLEANYIRDSGKMNGHSIPFPATTSISFSRRCGFSEKGSPVALLFYNFCVSGVLFEVVNRDYGFVL